MDAGLTMYFVLFRIMDWIQAFKHVNRLTNGCRIKFLLTFLFHFCLFAVPGLCLGH